MALILSILISFSTCAAGIDPLDAHVLAESPLESDGDALSVEVEADGHRLRLMLDTGSPGLQLDADHILSRVNGKPFKGDPNQEGLAAFQLPIRGPKSLKLGSAELDAGHRTFALILEAVRTKITRTADGIIGLDAFRDYVLEFDWDHQQLRLRNNVPKDLIDWVEFTRDVELNSFPVIRGNVLFPNASVPLSMEDREKLTEEERQKAAFEEEDQSHSIRFLLASNWPSTQDAIVAHSDIKVLSKKGFVTNADLVGNVLPDGIENKNFHYLVKNLRIGNQLQTPLLVESYPKNKVNILPVTWMLRYHLALDLPRRRLYFGPRKHTPPLMRNPNLTGLFVGCNAIPREGRPVKFSVLEVSADSVAAAADLQPLDEIVKFNGRGVGQFRPFEIEHAQHLPGTQYSLRIHRSLDKEFDVTIRVPPLPPKAILKKAN